MAVFGDMEENAALCRQMGLGFVEVNMNLPCFQTEGLESAACAANHFGVGMTIHADENFAPADFNPLLAEAHMETMRRTLRLARRLEIPVVNMHLNRGVYFSLPEGKLYLHGRYHKLWFDRMRLLREMCSDELCGSGTQVCIENTNGWLDYQREAIDLLLESEAFGLTWDIGHSNTADCDDERFLLERCERINHFHIHDARGRDCHLPLGAGGLKLDEYLMLASERRASCVLEVKTPDALVRSVDWLRRNGWL